MQKALAFLLAFSIGFVPVVGAAGARAGAALAGAAQDQSSYQNYTDDQLDNMLAPIALYPDPLLAQVLVAATFPDQIDEANRWVRSYGQNGVDDQPWDVSVRAVAHYPTVLDMMDSDLDWTTTVGQAYVYQSTDVMSSIQRLRAMAEQQGNLVTTPQQQVVNQSGYIYIWPASPEYIYVPVYDPSIVFFQRAYFGGIFAGYSFGPAFVIGVWLNLDFDWGRRRVYYTGWQGSGWIARSRSHIRINSIYVNPRLSNIRINRDVVQRQVNFQDMSRYRSIHRNVNFQNRIRGQQTPAQRPAGRVPNKIIDRNINPNQPLDQFRGYRRPTPAPAPAARPMPQQQQRTSPRPQQPRPTTTPMPQRQPQQPRNVPQVRQPRPAPAQRAPAARAPSPPAEQPPNAFGRGDSSFNTRTASQRGQQSRQQMNQRPAARPAPAPRPAANPAPAKTNRPSPQAPARRKP
ncbi:MAG TPA: DUF3300 domain-containing protein [Patescibacteria group bacterium]|nr:DUF3300 domain-containing protein [Patescibacteria group bacterium]